jgi:hypothetical protein
VLVGGELNDRTRGTTPRRESTAAYGTLANPRKSLPLSAFDHVNRS